MHYGLGRTENPSTRPYPVHLRRLSGGPQGHGRDSCPTPRFPLAPSPLVDCWPRSYLLFGPAGAFERKPTVLSLSAAPKPWVSESHISIELGNSRSPNGCGQSQGRKQGRALEGGRTWLPRTNGSSEPSETRETQFRSYNCPRNDTKTQGFRSIATRTPLGEAVFFAVMSN